MTNNEIYYGWLCQKVCFLDDENLKVNPYDELLRYLHSVTFYPLIDMDWNRCDDGVDLRYRFGYESDLEPEVIHETVDTNPCSVLEMMVALAIRVEENIMSDDDVGDRTPRWFKSMIESLGLINQTNDNLNFSYISHTIYKFINRQYDKDGKGGLVTIPGCHEDLRDIEIWYQMQMYLNYISREEW